MSTVAWLLLHSPRVPSSPQSTGEGGKRVPRATTDAIVECLSGKGPMTALEVGDALNITQAHARWALESATAKGAVVRGESILGYQGRMIATWELPPQGSSEEV